MPGHLEIDWEAHRTRGHDVWRRLVRLESEAARIADLTARLRGAPFIVGGDEHDIVRVDAEPERVFKLTRGDNFGCRSYFSPVDPDLVGHFHGEGNADPFFYLRRWRLLNSISEFQTRLEGIVAPARAGQLPRFCISQPFLPGVNSTPRVLREAMLRQGFVEISEGAFFDADRHLLLTDAWPRNVRVLDGYPVLFDVIAQIPPARVLAWCLERVRGRTGP